MQSKKFKSCFYYKCIETSLKVFTCMLIFFKAHNLHCIQKRISKDATSLVSIRDVNFVND